MANSTPPRSTNPPPLVIWPTGKLVLFGALLPLAGTALLVLVLASLAIRMFGDPECRWYEQAGAIWQASDPVRSVLVSGWLLVMSLGLLGFFWIIVLELRRRWKFPSLQEQQARQANTEKYAQRSLDLARSSYRTGWLWFLLGTPGLGICLGFRGMGNDPPQWATFLAFPLVALAPLYWMRAIGLGLSLWYLQGRPSRSLGYAILTFGVFFAGIFVVALSYLRA